MPGKRSGLGLSKHLDKAAATFTPFFAALRMLNWPSASAGFGNRSRQSGAALMDTSSLERIAAALEQAVPLLQTLVNNSRRVHRPPGTTGHVDATSAEDSRPLSLDSLPPEVSTAEAAQLLGVSKDTVLKLKDDGLLEYRNAAAPSSSRPIFLFSLQSVMTVRTTYRTDSPAPHQKSDNSQRRATPSKKYKHLRLSDN